MHLGAACRYAPPPSERQAARQLLIAAQSTRLYVAGQCPAGLGCGSAGARHTSPVVLELTAAAGEGGATDEASVSLRTAASVPRSRLGSRLSVRRLAAAADFAVLQTWDGAVLDTRCLAGGSAGGTPQRGQQGGSLDWSGLWRPPCCRAVAIAAGGCWQGEQYALLWHA